MSGIEQLRLPKWGLSMTQGTLLAWLVDEGADVRVGDEIADVETEKIAGSVESTSDGVLRRHVAQEGEVVPVGGLLGVVADPSVPDDEIDAFIERFQASFEPEAEAEEEGPQPETLEVGELTLRLLRQGEGEPLVLLHGFGGDLDNWLFAVPALAATHEVVALDLPGHGGSTKDVGDGVETLVEAVGAALDELGLDAPHLAGHSLGGYVAARVAATRPGGVRSLTLVAPVGLGDEIDADFLRGFVAANSRRQMKPLLQRLFADPELVTRSLINDVLKYKRIDGVSAALERLADDLEADGRQRLSLGDEWGRVDAPVTVVWGAQDAIIPASHADAAPEGAEVHVLDGAGHSPHMEAAGRLVRLVQDHLAAASTD